MTEYHRDELETMAKAGLLELLSAIPAASELSASIVKKANKAKLIDLILAQNVESEPAALLADAQANMVADEPVHDVEPEPISDPQAQPVSTEKPSIIPQTAAERQAARITKNMGGDLTGWTFVRYISFTGKYNCDGCNIPIQEGVVVTRNGVTKNVGKGLAKKYLNMTLPGKRPLGSEPTEKATKTKKPVVQPEQVEIEPGLENADLQDLNELVNSLLP